MDQVGMKSNHLKIDAQTSLLLPDPSWAASLFAILQTQGPYLQEWLEWPNKMNAIGDLQKMLKEDRALSRYGQKLCTYIVRQTQVIGSVALTRIDKNNRSAEMGFWLHQDFQGQGIMTQSCHRLIQYGFKHLHLHRLEMKIASSNLKSQSVAQRLAFQKEGCLRAALFRNGQFEDLLIYGRVKTSKE
ncbi:MAG: GNAT family protein [Bacteroidota bacterium]